MQRDNILIHSYLDIDSEKAMKQLKATRIKKNHYVINSLSAKAQLHEIK
jgi:uncharacterized protein YutE (UPF0331/DUF86 family)